MEHGRETKSISSTRQSHRPHITARERTGRGCHRASGAPDPLNNTGPTSRLREIKHRDLEGCETRQREMENRPEKKSALRNWLIRNVENPHPDRQAQDTSWSVISPATRSACGTPILLYYCCRFFVYSFSSRSLSASPKRDSENLIATLPAVLGSAMSFRNTAL